MSSIPLRDRTARLESLLHELRSVCVGYSGGVDSVYLSRVAVEVLGRGNVLAVTGRSAAYPGVQRDMAIECATRFDIPHLEIETEELADPRYAANPSNRCYFCKTELWRKLGAVASERGYAVVVDGSNADDAGDHRPGALAAAEWGVRSPLQEVGMTKAEIREDSRRLGLPTWDQPAAPCLASRLPYGLAVTPERLRAVEGGEAFLRSLGFREFRLRHHGDAARVELGPGELERGIHLAARIRSGLSRAGFGRVMLDVEGYRRGALNEGLPVLSTATASRSPHEAAAP